MLDHKKFFETPWLICISAGILILIFSGFFITPTFIANQLSPDGILEENTLQEIYMVRFQVVISGLFAIIFGALIYIFPSMTNRFFDFVSRPYKTFLISPLGKRVQTRYFYLPFCFACFFIALMLGLLFTQSGTGISPDSTQYIGAGENIYYGNGFYVGYSNGCGGPYTGFPPLYPLLIAAFMHFGFDAEQAARLIPILCFAFLMFPLFFLVKSLTGVFTGYITCIMCLVFTPLLWVTSYAWSEMPYIFFSVLAILSLIKFDGNDKTKMLCASGFFTALAIITRYIGITLLFVGLIVIILKSKAQLKKMVCRLLLFGGISSFPLSIWMYRNLIVNSHLSGYTRFRSYNIGLFTSLISEFLITIIKDFSIVISSIIITSLIVLVVITIICPAKRTVLMEYLKENYVIIMYIFIYLVTFSIIGLTWPFAIGTRYTAPICPFLILLLISFISKIKKSSFKSALFLIIAILCVLFFVFQVGNTIDFYQSAKDGLGSNAPFWKNNEGLGWIEDNVPDNATVYSNIAYQTQFKLKRPSKRIPYSSKNETKLNEFFDKLKNEENSFIICFKTFRVNITNEEFKEISKKYDILIVVADFPDSTIYKVKG